MRGDDEIYGSLFSYIDLEKRVPADHPLRVFRGIVNAALKSLSAKFGKLYSPLGRRSIPPERLMRAMLQAFIRSVRSGNWSSESTTTCCFAGLSGLGIEAAVLGMARSAGGHRADNQAVAVLNQGRWCFGKTPMQTFLDSLPLAMEKIMAA